ncbi:amidohydrolase [Spirosoma linguale]|uniref:Amidohydrolase 3 n=1 Tax=Spirosoma linguale (strain ATCC 33905 / DSM 74 / LMG 10896 / Claus 1) TaxID=504472 RepID=D2QHA0_SPILD|nr:Amidohydrolase 3 [Spirosoma linguale DSM 74]
MPFYSRRKFIVLVVAVLSLAVFSLQAQPADLVLHNGTIITIARPGDRSEAIAVRQGKILAVGTNDRIRTYIGKQTKVINLAGKTVVPGFNDAHLHPSPIYPFASPNAIVNLGPDSVRTMGELIALLKRKADLTPEGMPIQGLGYQDTKLGGHPTRRELDQVSRRHPVIIRHSSGHISAVNSFALEAAGVTKTTPDPAGGAFDRDSLGEPNGVCRESAAGIIRSAKFKTVSPLETETLAGYQQCFANYVANGITSITEAGSSFDKRALYEKLQAAGMPIRINLLMSEGQLDDVIKRGIRRGYGNESLRISGIKVFHGNSLSGRTCWLNEPYDLVNPQTGKKDYYGIPPKRSQAELDSLFLKIHRNGLQIACHSNGDREIEMVLAAFEASQQSNPLPNRRHRIEHCSVTTMALLQRIRRDSAMVVLHSYIYEHGDKMLAFGTQRFGMMHPNRTVMEMGIPIAQHSDSPISAAIPLLRIQSLATRRSAEGIVIGENQRISAEDAIRLWTYGGAYASFEEKEKGTLEVGKLADLVVLSDDPTTADVNRLKDIQVLKTIINGQVVYERP